MECWSGNWVEYFYDENGNPTYMLRYDEAVGFPQPNYFVTNLQGDVIAVCDNFHNPRFFYSYDAWGKLLSVTDANGNDVSGADNSASWNILRYRGYVYDRETGFYYVSSRYYDPEIGRWINADDYASTGQGVLGNNMYAYCLNNPVNMLDISGNWPSWGQVFSAVATVAVTAVFVAAVVASAGAVGVAAGVAAASIGATGTMVSAAITIGTIGTYAVATGIGACGLSNAGEILTGKNVIRDEVFGGDQMTYDTVQTTLNVVGGGAVLIGQTNLGVSGDSAKPNKNAQQVHKVSSTGAARSSFDKLYAGKNGEFQRTYYDFRGKMSLQIDFTAHSNPSIHSYPHLHIFWFGERKQINLWYLK